MPSTAARFRDLHRGAVLVLPNAWDAASAALIEAAGAPAIATTSAGVSWALGVADAHGLDREQLAAAIARIVQAVSVPVSADIEGGYGLESSDVIDTVRAIIAVGVSVGSAIAQAAYQLAARSARELLPTGSYENLVEAVDYAAFNDLVSRRR